ncbi:MAG: hypothetical protein OXF52_06095 [Candidatus Dadabacteria bacterium]|nr:hypothetical protein [Candidatus Dadabacteria bacterium]
MGGLPQQISISEPSDEHVNARYNVYCAIFREKVLGKNEIQVKLMTHLFAWCEWSWRVVGISEAALRHIKNRDYSSESKKGLIRHHFIQERTTTYRSMFRTTSRKKPMGKNEWWKTFWENDATVIVTKEEHDESKGEKSYYLPLNWRCGHFAGNSLIGFKMRKTVEGKVLKRQIEEDRILENRKNFKTLDELKNSSATA